MLTLIKRDKIVFLTSAKKGMCAKSTLPDVCCLVYCLCYICRLYRLCCVQKIPNGLVELGAILETLKVGDDQVPIEIYTRTKDEAQNKATYAKVLDLIPTVSILYMS